MKKTLLPIASLSVSLTAGLNAAVIYTMSGGNITDTATGNIFATYTTSTTAGETFTATSTGFTGLTSDAGTIGFVINITDPRYAASSIVWCSRISSTVVMGGTLASSRATFSLDVAGDLTTYREGWTLGGVATTNGVSTSYTANTGFVADGGTNYTDPLWEIVTSPTALTQNFSTAGPASINNEVMAVKIAFVPEPSSSALLGLAGLALVSRRKR